MKAMTNWERILLREKRQQKLRREAQLFVFKLLLLWSLVIVLAWWFR